MAKSKHSKEAREFDNARRRAKRKIKSQETLLNAEREYLNTNEFKSLTKKDREYHENKISQLEANIEGLKEDISNLQIRKVTNSKRGTKDYDRDINAKLNEINSKYYNDINSKSKEDAFRSNLISHEEFKLVMKQIYTYTFGKLWRSGMDNLQKREAIVRPVAEKYGIANPSEKEVMRFYEESMRMNVYLETDDEKFLNYTIEQFAGIEGGTIIIYTDTGSPIVVNIESLYAKHWEG